MCYNHKQTHMKEVPTMKNLEICDVTMKLAPEQGITLSFREKIELSKLLDRLGADVIEIEGITDSRVDALRIKSIASAVKTAVVAAPAALDRANAEAVWAALKNAARPRLQVPAAVSPVQMEYIYGKKPAAMLEAIADTVAFCREKTEDVEFIAEDATRADPAFLAEALNAAIGAGAAGVTLCDAAGEMLPDEFAAFLSRTVEAVPALASVRVGALCADTLAMATAAAAAAAANGANALKAVSYGSGAPSLQDLSRLLHTREDAFGVRVNVHTYELGRAAGQIRRLCDRGSGQAPAALTAHGEDVYLTVHDSPEAVAAAVKQLGYDLGEEDLTAVYAEFVKLAANKDQIDARELDAIVASAAMQTPPAYTLISYHIASGSRVKAMASVTLSRDGKETEGVSLGDGPIDAAFLALEQAAGRRCELDDFQIRAVTEGREAMGETVVRLLSGGRLYSGRGVSTDIVGAGILAYLNALNKIVYEEAEG